MTPDEFSAHLVRLRLSQTDFATVAQVTPRTVRRWAAEGVDRHATIKMIEGLAPSTEAVRRARQSDPKWIGYHPPQVRPSKDAVVAWLNSVPKDQRTPFPALLAAARARFDPRGQHVSRRALRVALSEARS